MRSGGSSHRLGGASMSVKLLVEARLIITGPCGIVYSICVLYRPVCLFVESGHYEITDASTTTYSLHSSAELHSQAKPPFVES